MKNKKYSVSYRLPKNIINHILILSEKLSLSKTGVIILGIKCLDKFVEKDVQMQDEIYHFSQTEGKYTFEKDVNMEKLSAEIEKLFRADLMPIVEDISIIAKEIKNLKERLNKLDDIRNP